MYRAQRRFIGRGSHPRISRTHHLERNLDMQWLELTVKAHPEAVESVSELLNRYAHGGVAIEEAIELIDEGQEYRQLNRQPLKLHAYPPICGQHEEARPPPSQRLWHPST